ncbi:MAG: HIT domain-containing protein [Chloroflexi bacterium]|nr:HIT domain-containing protein [Chloroflexota bacterium]
MSSPTEPAEPAGDVHSTCTAPATGGDRLWAPWRMRYVAGGEREEGCIFCNRLAEKDDVQSLVLHRGENAFVIMNRYPYNTGHVMIVPNTHVSSPEDADPEVISEMAVLRGPVLRALRRTLSSEGFNLGLNVGSIAGAGIADHLHEHVVPRWLGDANFMPILASTTVMPELIPVTYAKLRAELDREFGIGSLITIIVVSENRETVLVEESGGLPRVAARDGEPIWRTALRDAHERGGMNSEILEWSGVRLADAEQPAFLMQSGFPETDQLAPGNRLITLDELFAGPDADFARATFER